MSFDQRESSLAAGQPIRLYDFSRGVLRWAYASCDRNITWSNQEYRSLRGGIEDNGIIQSGDPNTDKLILTAAADLEVAQLYREGSPSDEVRLVVRDMHYGDSDVVISWVGSIKSVDWPALDRCKISCLSIEASMERPGLVDTYSLTCGAVLGDWRCKVNLELYRINAAAQTMSGTTITNGVFATYPDGWFTGGFVAWPVGSGNFDRRHIVSHQGSALNMLSGTSGIPAGVQLRVYPGCDFLIDTCHNKYGNEPNFRGENKLQGESPFDGNQVW
ncbi:phage BR0599 family protein [Pseudomonas panipatensis]|uniref:phage BR0599 family protein n=1 Tax=Pseudomonas panipatensis TaxID=428992 RepID=UPI0035AD86F8